MNQVEELNTCFFSCRVLQKLECAPLSQSFFWWLLQQYNTTLQVLHLNISKECLLHQLHFCEAKFLLSSFFFLISHFSLCSMIGEISQTEKLILPFVRTCLAAGHSCHLHCEFSRTFWSDTWFRQRCNSREHLLTRTHSRVCLCSWETSSALWRGLIPIAWNGLGDLWKGTCPFVSFTTRNDCLFWGCLATQDEWLCQVSILICILGYSGTILNGAGCGMIKFTTKSTNV